MKNWVKRSGCLIAASAVAVAMLVGCGEKAPQAVDLDENELAKQLSEQVTFEDTLEPVEDEIGLSLYGLTADQVASAEIYMSTSATPEEIAVLEAKDSDGVAALKSAAEQRIEDQKLSFEDYNPEQMPKLEDPLVVESGNYVILCISGDNQAAQDVIDQYIK